MTTKIDNIEPYFNSPEYRKRARVITFLNSFGAPLTTSLIEKTLAAVEYEARYHELGFVDALQQYARTQNVS